MKYYVTLNEREIPVDIFEKEGGIDIRLGNGTFSADMQSAGNGFLSLIIDGKQYDFHISENNGETVIDTGMGKYAAVVRDERERMLTKLTEAEGDKTSLPDLKAPMPGLIVKINAESGQEFKELQTSF